MIATPAFYSRAKQLGVPPGRAAAMPFFVLGILLALGRLAGVALTALFSAVDASPLASGFAWFHLNAFVLIAYIVFIRKNWLLLDSQARSIDDDA